MAEDPWTSARRAWMDAPPGRLIGRGHPAGDFLEAYDWDLLDEREGFLHIRAGLPDQVKNPRGQLFGGFTPTYVDIIALHTARAGRPSPFAEGADPSAAPRWMATTSMTVDYFEPIVGPTFEIRSQLEKRRGRTLFVVTKFFQDEELAVHARTTAREVDLDRTLGDA
jgi:acyl-coenzyme A thioesterase PaaI-like protein